MATSQLTNAITDVKARLAAIDGIKYVAVFNNQVKQEGRGRTFSFQKPAVLIELHNPMQGVALLGGGVTVNEQMMWRLSIVHQELNATDPITGLPTGTMDENLTVYKFRDAVKTALTGFTPTNCTALQYVEESQDYAHDQLYVYTISFKCRFTDSKGSPHDPDSTLWQTGQLTDYNLNTFEPWISGKTYITNSSAVLYTDAQGLQDVYLCTTGNADTIFNLANWQKISAWQPSTIYTATASYAAWQNHVYQCTVSNSDTTFTPAKWSLIV